MSLASLRPRTQLWLAVIIPLCCLPIVLYLVWHPVTNLRQVTKEIETTRQTVERKQELIRLAEQAALGRPLALAVAENSEAEPIVFIRQLTQLLSESGAKLITVQGTKLPPITVPGAPPPPSPKPGESASGSAAPADLPAPTGLQGQRPVLPATVNEISDRLTVEGDYGAVLSLLLRLETFDRILSVSQLQLSQKGEGE